MMAFPAAVGRYALFVLRFLRAVRHHGVPWGAVMREAHRICPLRVSPGGRT